jgi:hypothetical protein
LAVAQGMTFGVAQGVVLRQVAGDLARYLDPHGCALVHIAVVNQGG